MRTRQRIVEAISEFIDLHGYSPTVREVAAAAGISVGACYPQLEALRDNAVLTWVPETFRTLRLLDVDALVR